MKKVLSSYSGWLLLSGHGLINLISQTLNFQEELLFVLILEFIGNWPGWGISFEVGICPNNFALFGIL